MKSFTTICIFFLFFSFGSISIMSQENEYTVLTRSGDVFLINKISNDLTELQIGDKLDLYDRIKVNLGGYIVLIDTNLQSVELQKEGLYNISDIDTLFTMKRNSVTQKITKFILNEMSTRNAKFNEMKTLGAVVRKSDKKIEIAVPKFGNIVDTIYRFSWHPLPSNSSYIFRIFNHRGNTLFMKEIKDTSITLNLAKFNLQFDQKYFWSVFVKTSLEYPQDSIEFSLINPKEKQIIFDQVEDFKNDFLTKDSPMNFFLIAKYLGSKNMNETAIQYFEKSVQLYPNAKFYWSEYIHFLLDIGLAKEASAKWNKSPFSKMKDNKG